MKGVLLDYDTADRIALTVMKDQLKYLRDEVVQHEKNGKYMHPEDYHESKTKLIPSLEILIKHFGG